MNFFNRCWQLKLQFKNKPAKIYQHLQPDPPALSVDFKTQAGINTTATCGELTITGLLKEDIDYLATAYEPISGKLKPAFVEFSAGYEGGLSLLLFGNIFETVPQYTETADYSINVKIYNGLQQNQLNAYASVSFKGRVTLRDVVANIAKQLGYSLDIDRNITNRVLVDYSYQGTPESHLKSLISMYPDIEYSDKGNVLRLYAKTTSQRPKYKLSPNSGLLGTPQPTPTGIVCRSYLLPNLYSQDYIELESYKLKQLNGVYKIQTITHSGSTRGDPWHSTLTCLRT